MAKQKVELKSLFFFVTHIWMYKTYDYHKLNYVHSHRLSDLSIDPILYMLCSLALYEILLLFVCLKI